VHHADIACCGCHRASIAVSFVVYKDAVGDRYVLFDDMNRAAHRERGIVK
jgi:hypothetical protein